MHAEGDKRPMLREWLVAIGAAALVVLATGCSLTVDRLEMSAFRRTKADVARAVDDVAFAKLALLSGVPREQVRLDLLARGLTVDRAREVLRIAEAECSRN